MIDTALFSSSAFGVTLHDDLTLILNLDQSSFGPADSEVGRAMRHLAGLALRPDEHPPIRTDDYYGIARDYYDRLWRRDPTGKQALLLLAYLSSYYHEIRHVHDLLATPYGQDILLTTFTLCQNWPALLVSLADWQAGSPGRRIPLPLLDHYRELPDFPEAARTLLDWYAGRTARYRALREPSPSSLARLSTVHLLECSATNVQLDFIFDVFGERAYDDFVDFIRGGRRSSTYLRLRSEVEDAFYAAGYRSAGLGRIVNYLIWCSLVGTRPQTDAPGSRVHPATLYQVLAEHLLHQGNVHDLDDAQAAVAEFYTDWKLVSPLSMVDEARSVLLERVAALEQKWDRAADTSAAKFGLPLMRNYRSFLDVFDRLNRWIVEQPENYHGPRTYAWAVLLGMLPSVRVLVRGEGSIWSTFTPGYTIVPAELWEEITSLSASMRILLRGRWSAPSAEFIEDEVFEVMKQEQINGEPLRFKVVL